ncbi:MAG: hypothetical protein ABI402_04995 [Ferruginibacter sp.]
MDKPVLYTVIFDGNDSVVIAGISYTSPSSIDKMETGYKQILITNKNTLLDIQQAFSNYYPFLKIEFIQIEKSTSSLKNIKIDPATSLIQKLASKEYFLFDINEERQVAEVANELNNRLGMIAQMFRKSGTVWSLISLTDNWTLKSQNDAGKFISAEMSLPVK